MKMVVSFDVLSPDAHKAFVAWGETVGVQVKELSECEYRSWLVVCPVNLPVVERYGEEHLIPPLPVSPSTIASLCYTSVGRSDLS